MMPSLLSQKNLDYIDNYQVKRTFLDEHERDLTAEELAKKLEERYARRREEKESAPQRIAAQLDSSHRFTSQLLPKPSDPKVFAVKCKTGQGRSIVARLINKCFAYLQGQNYENKRVDLGIVSAFALDHVKEWFFVEAYRQLFVENALSGLDGVFRFRMAQVDPAELMQLMEKQAKRTEEIHVGDLVRFRRGVYKGDLGKVVGFEEEGKRVVAKVVPREDFVRKAYVRRPSGAPTLPQRFFVADMAIGARTSGGPVHLGRARF